MPRARAQTPCDAKAGYPETATFVKQIVSHFFPLSLLFFCIPVLIRSARSFFLFFLASFLPSLLLPFPSVLPSFLPSFAHHFLSVLLNSYSPFFLSPFLPSSLLFLAISLPTPPLPLPLAHPWYMSHRLSTSYVRKALKLPMCAMSYTVGPQL